MGRKQTHATSKQKATAANWYSSLVCIRNSALLKTRQSARCSPSIQKNKILFKKTLVVDTNNCEHTLQWFNSCTMIHTCDDRLIISLRNQGTQVRDIIVKAARKPINVTNLGKTKSHYNVVVRYLNLLHWIIITIRWLRLIQEIL